MRHIKFFTIAFLLLGTFLLSGSAFADDAMVFIGPGGNNLGGVYTYPYNFTVNGTPEALICDSFSNEVQSGETWTATEHFFNPSSSALFGSTASQNYLAAGLIFDSILGVNGISKTAFSSTISSDDANWAIWALFSGAAKTAIQTGDGTHFASGDANAFLIYTNALALAATVTNTSSDFNGIVIYTPKSGTANPSNLGLPQEYLGYVPVPEPSELSLVGILGLFATGGFAFRRRLATKLAIAVQ